MREPTHPKIEDIELSRVLYALSDPLRLKMVKRLSCEGDLACSVLVDDRPKSSMSHHFKVLRDSGIILTRIEGTTYFNSLRRKELNKLFPGLLDAIIKAKEETY